MFSVRWQTERKENSKDSEAARASRNSGPDTWHNPTSVGPFPGNKCMHGIKEKKKEKKARQTTEEKKTKPRTDINKGILEGKRVPGFFVLLFCFFLLSVCAPAGRPATSACICQDRCEQQMAGRRRVSLNEATWEEDELRCQLVCNCVARVIACRELMHRAFGLQCHR